MIRAVSRAAAVVLLLAAVAVGVLVGTTASGEDSSTVETASDDASVTRRVAFQANGAVREKAILSLGGLHLKASCQRGLTVTAETELEDSIVASSFGQEGRGGSTNFTFVNEGFGPDYGAYDVLGKAPSQTVGTMSFSRDDGGQVSLPFVADQRTPQGDCVFAGTATFTP